MSREKPNIHDEVYYGEHLHSIASNCNECFRTFLGHKIKGLLFNADKATDQSDERITLVFECGFGLTINLTKGSYWVERKDDIQYFIQDKKKSLEETQRETQEILALAGES